MRVILALILLALCVSCSGEPRNPGLRYSGKILSKDTYTSWNTGFTVYYLYVQNTYDEVVRIEVNREAWNCATKDMAWPFATRPLWWPFTTTSK